LTATSADGCSTKWRVVAVVGAGAGLRSVAQSEAQKLDGVALESKPDVRVHRCGHADVRMAEELLDDDEFDALLQEESRRRVAEVVEPDRP
jgi:hypothetical protein